VLTKREGEVFVGCCASDCAVIRDIPGMVIILFASI
jgi:hypothetical protein